jgi:hypothetical protein
VKLTLTAIVTLILSVTLIVCVLNYPGLIEENKRKKYPLNSKVAEITHVKGQVRVKNQTELGWTYVQIGDPIFIGDRLFTDLESTATIQLKTAVKIELEPETLITLFEEQSFEPGVEINQGDIQVETSKSQSVLSLKIDGEHLKVKALDKRNKFQIRSQGDKLSSSQIRSYQGSLEIKKSGHTQKLKEKETAKNYPNDIAEIQKRLFQNNQEIEGAESLEENNYIPNPPFETKTTNPINQVKYLPTESLKHKSDASSKFHNNKINNPTVQNSKEERLITQDANKSQPSSHPEPPVDASPPSEEKTESPNQELAKIDIPAPTLSSPIDGVNIFFVKKDAMSVKFQWEIVTSAQRYRIQIAKDPEFRFVIAEKETEKPNYEQSFPEPTKVYWRVQAIRDTYHSPWSETFSVGLE